MSKQSFCCQALIVGIVGIWIMFRPFTINGQILFPGQLGEELQQSLRSAYRPSVILNLSQAKDTLYGVIDNHTDSVECIYSGLSLHLPEGVDASQWLYMNGSGINLEHVYPQSKGADEGMAGHSDMHHLMPSRVAVNEIRGSHPFSDIPDQMTTNWYRNNINMQSIPASHIDEYSEYINGTFEPRESVKGDIARAVMYFYTIYQDDADAADPNYFPGMRLSLCAWHLADPVDDKESTRSTMVAHYQDNKENPFILDCTAALRAWCPEFQGCITSISSEKPGEGFGLAAFVTEGMINVHIVSAFDQEVLLSILDASGRVLYSHKVDVTAGSFEFKPDLWFAPGVYTISCLTSINPQQHITRCVIAD